MATRGTLSLHLRGVLVFNKKEGSRKRGHCREARKAQAKTTAENLATAHGESDVEQMDAICKQTGLEPTLERERAINRMARRDFSIPDKSWQLLVELFW